MVLRLNTQAYELLKTELMGVPLKSFSGPNRSLSYLSERVITIAGNSEAKGKTVACLLERSDETLKEFADDLVGFFLFFSKL